jgi:hypothetical protein
MDPCRQVAAHGGRGPQRTQGQGQGSGDLGALVRTGQDRTGQDRTCSGQQVVRSRAPHDRSGTHQRQKGPQTQSLLQPV